MEPEYEKNVEERLAADVLVGLWEIEFILQGLKSKATTLWGPLDD